MGVGRSGESTVFEGSEVEVRMLERRGERRFRGIGEDEGRIGTMRTSALSFVKSV